MINNLIYLYIFINIIFTKALLLLSIIFSLPIVNYTKSRLVKKATKISLEKNKMIKI
ncbi:MAG: hypothetical protein P1U46_02930 [Patescibacteria group bacterium]|nr:hypothetical protein [Patescibacteria group bacterium]